MQAGKATLKDISKATGFSMISIHRAIYNKEGLSDETRKKILSAVKEMGYEVNYMASALKRKTITVAFVLAKPRQAGNYHDNILQGGCAAFREVSGLNVVRKDYLFDDKDENVSDEIRFLEEIYASQEVDGVVVVPSNTRVELRLAIEKLVAKGLPVVLIDDLFDKMDYLCCISPRSDLIGSLGAECITKMCSRGKILVVHGDETSRTHIENVEGFASYLASKAKGFTYEVVHDPYDMARLAETLCERIGKEKDVVALYTVRERNTEAVCKAALRYPDRHLVVLGSDLCPSNVEYLQQGVLSGIIDKNPYQRGYLAMHILTEYLLKNEKPKAKVLSVPISIVMQSNLPLFVGEKGLGICISSSPEMMV
jgi:LacI family transcriptional regulator